MSKHDGAKIAKNLRNALYSDHFKQVKCKNCGHKSSKQQRCAMCGGDMRH